MSLYENWIQTAYTSEGQHNAKVWDDYLAKEQKIYEDILVNKIENISGTVLSIAERFNLSLPYATGFIDGINEALPTPIDVESLEETTALSLQIQFEKLYKKMVEFKAEHLYTLPQWDGIFTPEEQERLYKEEKKSRTIIKEDKIGRNEPCPCGSGKKYKKCCGA